MTSKDMIEYKECEERGIPYPLYLFVKIHEKDPDELIVEAKNRIKQSKELIEVYKKIKDYLK